MKNLNQQLLIGNKVLFTSLILWSYGHSYILIKNLLYSFVHPVTGTRIRDYYIHSINLSEKQEPDKLFYPFTIEGFRNQNFNLLYYDFTEYFVYVGGVWLIYFLYRYWRNRH